MRFAYSTNKSTARERNRLQARFIIRERVVNNSHHPNDEPDESTSCVVIDDDDTVKNHADQATQESEKDFAHDTTQLQNRLVSTEEEEEQQQQHALPPQQNDDNNIDLIKSLLQRIIDNDRSFFSVTFLADNETLLSSIFSTLCLWQQRQATKIDQNDDNVDKNNANDDDSVVLENSEEQQHQQQSSTFLQQEQEQQRRCLLGEEKLLSWYGHDVVKKELCTYFDELKSFTFIEYALLFQRYYIVGSFINGGINPCRRGGSCDSDNHFVENNNATKLLHRVGEQVLRRFVMDPVPLPLSSYMVKRAFDLRFVYWKRKRRIQQQQEERHDAAAVAIESFCCPVCRGTTPLPSNHNLLVCFPSCQHIVCEACFWIDSLERLNDRNDNEDVIQCQVCTRPATRRQLSPTRLLTMEENTSIDNVDQTTTITSSLSSSLLSPKDRFEQSRQRYLSLPTNARELKSLKETKKKCQQNGRFILAATWSDAIRPSLGLTQNVRRDKFFLFVERGAYHHVRTCLEAGIDLSLQNEYGQTALYICAWRGYDTLVDLLLQYGSDPCTSANGGGATAAGIMTPLRVAASSGHEKCYNLIRQHISIDNRNGSEDFIQKEEPFSCCYPLSILPESQLETLIPETACHPGAGSYLLHDILSDQEIDELIELWKTLPIAPPEVVKKKKKVAPCSIRSYFCDTEYRISRLILRALGSFQQEKPLWCKSENIDKSINDNKDSLDPLPVVLPHMRFLCYQQAGSSLAPHVDLTRVEFVASNSGTSRSCDKQQQPRRSTHSFLLYLTHCEEGGETTLLKSLSGTIGQNNVLARIKPRRGHLLLFPHNCPHQGEEVVDVPKLLIRGEVILPHPPPLPS